MSSTDKFYKSTYDNFEKLNKLNYTSWRAKVTGVLRSLRAYKIVTGEEQAPPNGGNSAAARAAIADYDARFAQAEATIRLSVNDDIAERLEGVEDPAEMWEILRKEFDSTASEARRMKLAIEVHGLRDYVPKKMKRSPPTAHASFDTESPFTGAKKKSR